MDVIFESSEMYASYGIVQEVWKLVWGHGGNHTTFQQGSYIISEDEAERIEKSETVEDYKE